MERELCVEFRHFSDKTHPCSSPLHPTISSFTQFTEFRLELRKEAETLYSDFLGVAHLIKGQKAIHVLADGSVYLGMTLPVHLLGTPQGILYRITL
jgi:hypothetical protein